MEVYNNTLRKGELTGLMSQEMLISVDLQDRKEDTSDWALVSLLNTVNTILAKIQQWH